MGIALAFSSPLDNNDSMPRRRLAGYVMTDSNIYTARDAWVSNPTAAEALYAHALSLQLSERELDVTERKLEQLIEARAEEEEGFLKILVLCW